MYRKASVVIAMLLAATFVNAAELTLFDIPIRTAAREEIRTAIVGVGGKLRLNSRDREVYDARGIGLPGATELEVIYLQDRLVMAQYILDLHGTSDEHLRKMLTSKYGQPRAAAGQTRFDEQHIREGKYRWSFDHEMELVFTRDFFLQAPTFLSYVNKAELSRLEKQVKDAAQRAAEREAAAKKSIF